MQNCYAWLAEKNNYFAHMGKTRCFFYSFFWFNLLVNNTFQGAKGFCCLTGSLKVLAH
jgi:hypothetical protein